MNRILKDLGLKGDVQEDNIITNLYKRPIEKKQRRPHVDVFAKGYVYQADLLYLPHDGPFKYALVVVDVATHAMDAEPIRDKTNATVLKAFQKIFKRKYLPMPKFKIETDPGSEFKGSVKQFFNQHNIVMRTGAPDRHRQQGVVEWMNYIIGKVLFMLMTLDELHTGITTRDWVEELPEVVKAINEHLRKDPPKPKLAPVKALPDEDILPIGTEVRYALDAPIAADTEMKLHGRFRAGDIRWSIKPVKIDGVYLQPGQPVFYSVAGRNANYFTRDQLQLYDAEEKTPRPRKFRVEAIVGKKTEGRKTYYKLRWLGYDEDRDTWEDAVGLKKDIPLLIDYYEKNAKKNKNFIAWLKDMPR